ncbi:hypothetical protein SmJEL517_g03271 [Synchytrium microbalum]|uniref:TFIID subunit TAF5 NTD2 domain-containing protein n=1 Tax=Synchytrium microbalum TaxID=1806994 RepID=A0A507C308_9FUNG|nr:uncharacterized protein SmJEL517_g03271 [Synchytrium microbalum]TPX34082.1 hypothetical protein SmJEL517_g03271 [Synchytrium microbalum]
MQSGGQQSPAEAAAVSEYLKSRGFTRTEASFREEFKVKTVDDLQAEANKRAQLAIPNFLLQYSSDDINNPSAHEQSYIKLRRFVDESFTTYKVEFKTVLFPVYVHSYLELIERGFIDQARHFLNTFKTDHAETHAGEIQRLASITNPQQLRENDLAQNFRNNKYFVSMSRYAFELLLHFLESNAMLVLRILNQYVSIKATAEKLPGAKEKSANDVGDMGILGYTTTQLDDIGKIQLRLGQLPPDEWFKDQVERDLAADGGELLGEYHKKIKVEADSLTRETSVPMPPKHNLDVEKEIQALNDIRKRASLNSGAMPSIICYTFHNTYDNMSCLAMSDDTKYLCAGFTESFVRVWNLKDDNDTSGTRLVGHSAAVYGVSFSPDSRALLSCSGDNTARLWIGDSFMNVSVYKGHNYPVWDVEFGPEGIYFATASHDKTARLWNVEYSQPLRIFADHMSDVDCVRFHPNSNYLVTGSSDRTARFWDVNSGKCVRVFTGHSGTVYAVAVSPDGKMIATAGEDKTIGLWDIASGKRLKTMTGHTDVIYSLDFSQDSCLLSSGSADDTVRIWDAKRPDGNELGRGIQPMGAVHVKNRQADAR